MRGEHQPAQLPEIAAEGSPPHARGTHEIQGAVYQEIGITPACAGNTVAPVKVA